MQNENTQEPGSGSFFLSAAELGKEGHCNPGDIIRLRVVDVGDNGEYEVELDGVEKSGDASSDTGELADELRSAMDAGESGGFDDDTEETQY
jgi:hypothetical protein